MSLHGNHVVKEYEVFVAASIEVLGVYRTYEEARDDVFNKAGDSVWSVFVEEPFEGLNKNLDYTQGECVFRMIDGVQANLERIA